MTPLQDEWSVWPWWRYDAELPDTEGTVTGTDGVRYVISEAIDPAWAALHRREGASIHDHDRGVTYNATVDDRGQLDYLEVIIDNGRMIDDNAMRRVPIATIRRVVLDHLASAARARAVEGDDVITLTLPGGLSSRPSLEDVAKLMREGYDRPALHAMFPSARPRTVDGWMRRARQKYPTTPDGARPSAK